MGLRAFQLSEPVQSDNLLNSLEKKLTTLLNAIYCEEDIYMHPYRKSLSLKEWQVTYMKSKVDFSFGVRISSAQYQTLKDYSKRVNLDVYFDRIHFMSDGDFFYLHESNQLNPLINYLQHVHTAFK